MNVHKIIKTLATFNDSEICEMLKDVDDRIVKVIRCAVFYYQILQEAKMEELVDKRWEGYED